MYYVYILYSKKDKKLYVGCTNNLRERIKMHNAGKILSTKFRRPLELIFYEAYKNQKDAFAREKFFKTGWGRNYVKRILNNTLISSKNLGERNIDQK